MAFAYLGVAVIWIGIAGVHTVIEGLEFRLPQAAWPFVVMSSVGLSFYYYGTLAALRRGNLSVYYPIIRSSPLAIVVFNWLVLDQTYSILALAGIGLIIGASLAIQKAPGSLFNDWRALLLAFMAMVASAAYALADAHAMRHASPAPFLFWCYSLVSIQLFIVCLLERPRAKLVELSSARKNAITLYRILIASVSSYASYYLILMAFQFQADPALVSAVRQASIPVSVVLAAILLKEPRFLHRMGWATLLAAGIVMIMAG